MSQENFTCPVCLEESLVIAEHGAAPLCIACSSHICDECYGKCPVQNMCFICKTPLFEEDRVNKVEYRFPTTHNGHQTPAVTSFGQYAIESVSITFGTHESPILQLDEIQLTSVSLINSITTIVQDMSGLEFVEQRRIR